MPREVYETKDGPGPGTYEDNLGSEKLSNWKTQPTFPDKKQVGFGSSAVRKTDANFILQDKLETAKERKTAKNIERGAYELVEAYEVYL